MNKCFVMQPFDGDAFDKRYDDVLKPAIISAGLEDYRVDRDPNVDIPIDHIVTEIRASKVCLADISVDNPNVWFELGYALGVQKDVVLICSDQRKDGFPFDVRHRSIIKYKTGSPSDFEALKEAIKSRLMAIIKKQEQSQHLLSSPINATEGLDPHEVVTLVTVMQHLLEPDDAVSPQAIRNNMEAAGYTELATSLSIKSLLKKKLIEVKEVTDFGGSIYIGYATTPLGDEWLLNNQAELTLTIEEKEAEEAYYAYQED